MLAKVLFPTRRNLHSPATVSKMDLSCPRRDTFLAAGLSVTKELRWRNMDAYRQPGQGHGAYRIREAPRGRPEPHRNLDIYQRSHRHWRSFANGSLGYTRRLAAENEPACSSFLRPQRTRLSQRCNSISTQINHWTSIQNVAPPFCKA
jgi:hypothetical protein